MTRLGVRNRCYTTPCKEGPVGNYCSNVTQPYFIDGKRLKLELEETMRDNCKDPTTKKKGTSLICCPKNSLGALLMSLSSAEDNEFPHMGRVDGGCGATVYNKDFLISAAHCFVNTKTGKPRNPKEIEVILGTNLGNLPSKNNTFGVSQLIIHQNFSQLANSSERKSQSTPRIFNDIALLKLNRSINFNKHENIRAMEIAPVEFNPELYADQVVIIGWGTTALGTATQHLQKSNLILRTDRTCFNNSVRYPTYGEFSNQLLCAGGIVGKSISNQAGSGDSGGPAICRGKEGNAVLCGITSFGSGYEESECVEKKTEKYCQPSVFTDVGYFRKWIIDNAGEQNEKSLLRAKLYGDHVRDQRKFNHQVHIQSRDGKTCGGTLVDQSTVVTAAQCVKNDDGKIRTGIEIIYPIRNLKETVLSRHVYRPRNITVPKEFSKVEALERFRMINGRTLMRDSLYHHDIAVIKLDRATGIKDKKLPKLPTHPKFEVETSAEEISFPLNTTRSGALSQRNFTILTREDCTTRLKRFKALGADIKLNTEQIICGVEEFSGGSTCDREIGGGLLCRDEDGFEVLCGVQTFRLCETTLPSFFLNVGKYLDLIDGVVRSEDSVVFRN